MSALSFTVHVSWDKLLKFSNNQLLSLENEDAQSVLFI